MKILFHKISLNKLINFHKLITKQQAEVAQLVEHQPSKLNVAGSSLVFRSH